METSLLDRFGRVLIPKRIRDAAGLRPGDALEVVVGEHGVELRPAAAQGSVVLRHGVPVYVGPLADPGEDLVGAGRAARHGDLLRRAGLVAEPEPGRSSGRPSAPAPEPESRPKSSGDSETHRRGRRPRPKPRAARSR